MKKSKTKVEQLLDEHAAIYKTFLPTLTAYQEMAQKAVELQIKIYDARLREVFPKAEFTEAPLIVVLSARETPARFTALLEELAQKKIEVTKVVFNPRALSFNLYGK